MSNPENKLEAVQITLRFRVKDKHASRLNAQARAVSFVWNYCNETQKKAALSHRKWLSWLDLGKLTRGATTAGLDLHSATVNRVCHRYAASRNQQRKPWLKWRGRKSLGWVPFNTGHVVFRGGAFLFRGTSYQVWLTREIPEGARFGAGSFNQDSRGRWYINVPMKVTPTESSAHGEVGVDLGLKTLATLSDGNKIEMPAYYRAAQDRIGKAQRANKKRLKRALHAKTANQRRDYLHKASANLARTYGLIVVGNVSPSKLAKTRMAKSVHDAGWSDFRSMLAHKALRHGGIMIEVDEAYSTQICSECGTLPDSRPAGFANLGVRAWTCSECGAIHDRDVNAARNILRSGQRSLIEGAARCGVAKSWSGMNSAKRAEEISNV